MMQMNKKHSKLFFFFSEDVSFFASDSEEEADDIQITSQLFCSNKGVSK